MAIEISNETNISFSTIFHESLGITSLCLFFVIFHSKLVHICLLENFVVWLDFPDWCGCLSKAGPVNTNM